MIVFEQFVAADDRGFFLRNPERCFRARAFVEGETFIPFFTTDELGETGEVNVTIVKSIKGGRARRFFRVATPVRLTSDKAIKTFLRSRGIKPSMFHGGAAPCCT